MSKSIRIRAKQAKDNATQVKVLIKHPMETGLRKDKKTGAKIPAHFIQEVKCYHNNELVLDAVWGVAVSQNPYLSFTLDDAAKGDNIRVSWLDNNGGTDQREAAVK